MTYLHSQILRHLSTTTKHEIIVLTAPFATKLNQYVNIKTQTVGKQHEDYCYFINVFRIIQSIGI